MEQNEDQLSGIVDKFAKNLILESSTEDNDDEIVEVDEDDEEFEFSFIGEELKPPVSPTKLFLNGQIRPIFPINEETSGSSDEDTSAPPVKKVFMVAAAAEDGGDMEDGQYFVWSTGESPSASPSPSPDMCRKSNSTGFSRLWKMKDLLSRSNSDGKDTLVLVRKKKKVSKSTREESSSSTSVVEKDKKGKMVAFEALYGNKEKNKGGRKCYLPYKKDLVGFFTTSNVMTKNIHPY